MNTIYRLDLTQEEYQVLHGMISKIPVGNNTLAGKISSPKVIHSKGDRYYTKQHPLWENEITVDESLWDNLDDIPDFYVE